MATSRRMPTNIDVLDALTEKVAQEGNTTIVGGNLEVDGSLKLNEAPILDVGSQVQNGYVTKGTSGGYTIYTYYGANTVRVDLYSGSSIVATRTINFPTQSGPLVSANGVKTLFGNKSILGSGNIDLYQHVIKGQALNGGSWGGSPTEFMLTVISSKNLKVDSLTDLKTLLGNTFEHPATGYYDGNTTAIWKIDQAYAYDVENTVFTLASFTFTDTVTTV